MSKKAVKLIHINEHQPRACERVSADAGLQALYDEREKIRQTTQQGDERRKNIQRKIAHYRATMHNKKIKLSNKMYAF